MTPRWPLPVASHLLIPAGPAASDDGGCIHLCDLVSATADRGAAITDLTTDITASAAVAASGDGRAGSPAASLCGRAAMVMAVHPDLDLLGGDHHRLCGSCWRIVERWLTPPPPAPGEDLVVAWLVESVLAVGEAMIEGVPVARLEPLRRHVRHAIKAAIGGSVRTAKISPEVLWVWSGLVNDAKSDQLRAQELRDGIQRVSASSDGHPLEAPRWRRDWRDLIADNN